LAINSRSRKRRAALPIGDVESLTRRLQLDAALAPVPLLVVRLRDLERIAWREGRAAARSVERRSLRSFIQTASRTLRATDILAHNDESEDFLAALVSPNRQTGSVATPTDCRATLARLASAMELAGGMHVETGWTVLYATPSDSRLTIAIESALERGARERERYAFFSTIGHELRTPLTSIRGYIETLLEENLDPVTTRRFLEVARTEATRMSRLVDGMFDISMLDLRSEPGYLESCELTSTIASALNVLAPVAAAHGTSITHLAAPHYNVAIGCDRLIQIVINIIENAIKHGLDGGRVYVSSAALDARYVEVRVDDDGPGVPAEERELVFTLARRGANARARGSGLGLAVVRLMLERIGGEVDVTSSLMGGAQFRIRLPLVPPPAPPAQEVAETLARVY
jgi:signal transduction histidine kinase